MHHLTDIGLKAVDPHFVYIGSTSFDSYVGTSCCGPCGSPADVEYGQELGKFVLVYLDEILIFSKSPEERAQHLRIVLGILRKHDFYAKMSNCEFNKPELQFLGHIVGQDGIKMDPRKTAAIDQWPMPKDVHQLSFIGLATYFRKFVQGFSNLVRPIYD